MTQNEAREAAAKRAFKENRRIFITVNQQGTWRVCANDQEAENLFLRNEWVEACEKPDFSVKEPMRTFDDSERKDVIRRNF